MESILPASLLGDSLLVSLAPDITGTILRKESGALLERMSREGCRQMVLDFSSVEVLDTHDFAELARLGSILRLMGSRTVVCGLRPSVAFAAAALGVELPGIDFVGTLDQINDR